MRPVNIVNVIKDIRRIVIVTNSYASKSREMFQQFLLFLLDREFSLVFSLNNMDLHIVSNFVPNRSKIYF